jgi:hypothetical protein
MMSALTLHRRPLKCKPLSPKQVSTYIKRLDEVRPTLRVASHNATDSYRMATATKVRAF